MQIINRLTITNALQIAKSKTIIMLGYLCLAQRLTYPMTSQLAWLQVRSRERRLQAVEALGGMGGCVQWLW